MTEKPDWYPVPDEPRPSAGKGRAPVVEGLEPLGEGDWQEVPAPQPEHRQPTTEPRHASGPLPTQGATPNQGGISKPGEQRPPEQPQDESGK